MSKMAFITLVMILSSQMRGTAQVRPSPIGSRIDLGSVVPRVEQKEVNGRFILLDFWATWCAPCIDAFPMLDSMAGVYKDNLLVLAISDESPGMVQRFLKKRNYTNLRFATDTAQLVFRALQVDMRPLSALLHPDGSLLWVGHSGGLANTLPAAFAGKKDLDMDSHLKERYARLTEEKQNAFVYFIRPSGNPDDYLAITQKGQRRDSAINIEYRGALLTEIIQDLLDARDVQFKASKTGLDTILVDLKALASISELSYRRVAPQILQHLGWLYGFSIQGSTKRVDILELSVADEGRLGKYISTDIGGGMIRKNAGVMDIKNISAAELAGLIEKQLKQPVQFSGTWSKRLNLSFKGPIDLLGWQTQLEELGFRLKKNTAELQFWEVH